MAAMERRGRAVLDAAATRTTSTFADARALIRFPKQRAKTDALWGGPPRGENGFWSLYDVSPRLEV